MIGHQLANRYTILARIGGGGMAIVYKAHDVLLGRNVAVKVLKKQFVDDEEFIQRFRREGQSAAALSHPNVVSIYDVGQEDDIHYIVMEYVEGFNLNEIIQERAPLQADEAVHIAQQICDALEHAHQSHIIHRDIKPHNILIGNNGRVKVTDFGIARAVTSSTITHTGSVLGSVHYFSPEHAKGIGTGEQSDLYSLGIVLYQMLTCQLPFLGESPISVALKHLQEEFEPPRKLNPHIPQSLENIILKAMRKKPAERYHSAREMQHDLETCLSAERRNEPRISFDNLADLEETKILPDLRKQLRVEEANHKQSMNTGTGVIQTGAGKLDDTDQQVDAVSTDTSVERQNYEEEDRRNRWVKPLIAICITILIVLLAFWGFKKVLAVLNVPEVAVPTVINEMEADAIAKLKEVGLEVADPIVRVQSKEVELGRVIEQSKQNQRVKKGSFIQLTVSEGEEKPLFANYVGTTSEAAIRSLVGLGLDESQQIVVDEVYDDQEIGKVISQSIPEGTEFDPQSVIVKLTVSLGPKPFPMPELIGLKLEAAKALIAEKGLVLEASDVLFEENYLYAEGIVISQDPYKPNDDVVAGEKISLRVSLGVPEEALEHTFNIHVSPAEVGMTSEIKIIYSDARGQNVEAVTKSIHTTTTFRVTALVTTDNDAKISIYRDGKFVGDGKINHAQVKEGASSSTIDIPHENLPTPQPTPEPTQEPIQPTPDPTEDVEEAARLEQMGHPDQQDGEDAAHTGQEE